MRFWKKKYYKEVKCKACKETGVFVDSSPKWNLWVTSSSTESFESISRIICPGCKGRGTQTVLEREE